jgi:nucleoid DNA-binding protein
MNEKINLQELIVLLAQKSNITKKEAETFLRECFDTMHEALLDDKLVKVKNLGAFKLTQVNDRESVDVVTGERVLIPAHYKVGFSPENSLAQAINEPFSLFVPVELNEDDSIVDSGEIISFVEEEETQEENEFIVDFEDDDKAFSEPVLINSENTEETISFILEKDTEEIIRFAPEIDTGETIHFAQEFDFSSEKQEDTEMNIEETIIFASEKKKDEDKNKNKDKDFKDINQIQLEKDILINWEDEKNIHLIDKSMPSLEIPIELIPEIKINNNEKPSEKIEIEKPNENAIQFDLTLDINKALPDMNIPIDIAKPKYDTEKIEIPYIQESSNPIEIPVEPASPVEIPPITELERPIEMTSLKEPVREPVKEPVRKPVREPARPVNPPEGPIYGDRQPQPIDSYTIYNPKKHKPKYPYWLVMFSYFAIILGVVFFFYRLYQNPTGGVSAPPVINTPQDINNGKNINNAQNDTKITIDLSHDSLGKALKEKFGDLPGLSGTPSGNTSSNNTPANKKTNNTGKPTGRKAIVQNGQTLTRLALNEYGHRCFWVYIYEENKQIITNPDNVPVGTTLTIPPPEKYGINKNDAESIRKATEKADQMRLRH